MMTNSVYDKFRCRLLLYKTLSVGLRNKASKSHLKMQIAKKLYHSIDFILEVMKLVSVCNDI